MYYKIDDFSWGHIPAVVSTVTSQEEGFGFDLASLSFCVFSLSTLVSSYIPKTCRLGQLATLN